jgi:phage/plasmid-like protein (TIGR03299 family)
MPSNVQTMAYVGEVPWHGQGSKVPPGVNAGQMIQAAGLDWNVEKRPARGSTGIVDRRGHMKFARYELVRLPRSSNVGSEVVLGLVSSRYQPLQNRSAFSFFDPIIDSKTATYETAGALGDGERVWVMAKMPGEIQVVRGDDCRKYLLLSNTHNGQGSVVVKFTAVRVVCENTLTMAMRDGQSAYRVRHSSKMNERLDEVATLIAAANETYRAAAVKFQRLAQTPVKSGKVLQAYLRSLFPLSAAQKLNDTHSPKWDHVTQLFETAPDLQLPGVRGTMWAAYNAVTRFEDYRGVERESPSQRLNRVWFGAGADLKVKALEEAVRLSNEN